MRLLKLPLLFINNEKITEYIQRVAFQFSQQLLLFYGGNTMINSIPYGP